MPETGRTQLNVSVTSEQSERSAKGRGSGPTLLDIPLVKLKGKGLLELLDEVLGLSRRADGGMIAELDECAKVAVVLGQVEGLVGVVDADCSGQAPSETLVRAASSIRS